jgi:hypothetical protein
MEEKYKESLKEIFKSPPNEFRMMPFWFWNHEMVEKEVTRQIQDHHDHGIGGEFIHPRHGRLTPYLGERWMENVEAAADKCKELGMPCFLYDEDNWPSGPVGGEITGPYRPENRGKWLAVFDENVFEGPAKVEYKLDYQLISPETTFYAAIAVPNPETYPSFADVWDKWIDVSSCVCGDTFSWETPKGEWTVVFFCILINAPNSNLNGYIDVLRKETCREFIKQTHEKYTDYFIKVGKLDYLGTVIPGIFTDEPSMNHQSAGGGDMMKSTIFTPTMPRKFKQMFGYDFNEVLLSLFFDTGKISAKHRCNYWLCTTAMYVDAFYKQIYEFCDQYNWRFTGHVNCEGNFPSHIVNQGDFFKVFEYMHYGGVDQLTEDVRADNIEDIYNIKGNPYSGMAQEMLLASKLASSAAHLLGKPRVLVEAFGTSSWDITLASCKRVNDYLILTGCDLFVPHDFAYSEEGYRKQDHPASFPHQPYYVHWKKLMDHNGRLCALLNAHSGVLQAEMLFFYPARTFYAEMMPRTTLMAQYIGNFMTHNADCLFRQQIDFEIANEEMILGGKIIKDNIKIRDESFKCICLGATTCISLDFAQFLLEYFERGGKILASMVLPTKDSEVGESDEIANIMHSIFGVDPKALQGNLLANKISTVQLFENSNNKGGKAIFIQTPYKEPWVNHYYPNFVQACEKLISQENKDVNIWTDAIAKKHASYVMVNHKKIDDKDIYFMANTSREANYAQAKVEFNVNPESIELWDTLDGSISKYTYYGVEKGKTTMTLNFPPYQSYLFVITPSKKDKPVATKAEIKVPADKVSPNYWKEPISEIALGTKWDCKFNSLNGAMLNEKWVSSYQVEAGRAWGYQSVRTFTHEFNVKGVKEISPVKLVIEGLTGDYGWCKTTFMPLSGGDRAHFRIPSNVCVEINDKLATLSYDFNVEYLDVGWIVTDITSLLKEGKNVVKFKCTTHNHETYHVITDPWRLVGNFELEMKDGIPFLSKARSQIDLKDIGEQGFARYHGGFSYVKDFQVTKDLIGKKFVLDIAKTIDCVEVWLNGKLFDVLWNTWTCEITKAVKIGESNKIELVYYGIAQNMLQTNIKPQGLQGEIKIRVY